MRWDLQQIFRCLNVKSDTFCCVFLTISCFSLTFFVQGEGKWWNCTEFCKSNRQTCHLFLLNCTLRICYSIFLCDNWEREQNTVNWKNSWWLQCIILSFVRLLLSKIASNYLLWKWKKRRFKSFFFTKRTFHFESS